ncbi:putative LOC102093720 [Columba livia]|uniref:Putative LOC102093720 n=1 Tax=Columba livia TaxID=8932 RepID=A0A2I0LHL4_COLLI|nr:putative LOC102093720 [Columba livia]
MVTVVQSILPVPGAAVTVVQSVLPVPGAAVTVVQSMSGGSAIQTHPWNRQPSSGMRMVGMKEPVGKVLVEREMKGPVRFDSAARGCCKDGWKHAEAALCAGLATTLMDATTDKAPLVQEQIYKALCELGESEPEEILNACDEYLRQHDKLAYPHRVIILKAMETVVKNNIALLDKSTAKVVIFLASNEMTKSKWVLRVWVQRSDRDPFGDGKSWFCAICRPWGGAGGGDGLRSSVGRDEDALLRGFFQHSM